MLILAIGGDGMVDSYGELVRQARDAKDISAKQLSEKLNVSAPFITDIEKNRRLPSLQNQKKIKKLLISKQFPETLFDDLAAAGNDDTRIVAEDIAKDIRKKPALRELIRAIHEQKLTAAQIAALTASIGGNENGK